MKRVLLSAAIFAALCLPALAGFNGSPEEGGFVAPVVSSVASPVTDLGNNGVFNAASISVTCATSVAAGKLVVVFVYDQNASVTSTLVTDSKSNTYTRSSSSLNASTNPGNVLMYYSFITTPLTTSDIITYTPVSTAADTMRMSASWVTGYTSHDAATDNGANNGFAATYTVTGAGSASVANEIYFGFAVTNSTFTGTPSGWTTSPPSTPASGSFLAAWQINSGTAALTFNGSTSATQFTGAVISSFKP